MIERFLLNRLREVDRLNSKPERGQNMKTRAMMMIAKGFTITVCRFRLETLQIDKMTLRKTGSGIYVVKPASIMLDFNLRRMKRRVMVAHRQVDAWVYVSSMRSLGSPP
jgi:hypothetical protein